MMGYILVITGAHFSKVDGKMHVKKDVADKSGTTIKCGCNLCSTLSAVEREQMEGMLELDSKNSTHWMWYNSLVCIGESNTW
tara:strand:+ start:4479 stop:4724 length:246 start_codon:yes stop_codon:yes gene_type:complete